jgi:hypothetical protein
MTIADPYFSAKRAPQPDFRMVGASNMVFENPYRMFANNAGRFETDRGRQPLVRPRYFGYAAVAVIVGTIISGLVGYFSPGPITGLFLPIFVTLWWLLYRVISKFDTSEDG